MDRMPPVKTIATSKSIMSTKRTMPEWKRDAARLKALFDSRAVKLTQKEFGRRHGIGTQSMVSQYLNGETRLTHNAATKFAIGLGIQIEAFSPTLANASKSGATRTSITFPLRTDLRGKMMQAAGKRSSDEGRTVHLHELYEEAVVEYLASHFPNLL